MDPNFADQKSSPADIENEPRYPMEGELKFPDQDTEINEFLVLGFPFFPQSRDNVFREDSS